MKTFAIVALVLGAVAHTTLAQTSNGIAYTNANGGTSYYVPDTLVEGESDTTTTEAPAQTAAAGSDVLTTRSKHEPILRAGDNAGSDVLTTPSSNKPILISSNPQDDVLTTRKTNEPILISPAKPVKAPTGGDVVPGRNVEGTPASVPTSAPTVAATPAPTAAPAPVVATEAPVVATAAPVVATAAPVVATAAPVVATAAPVVATAAPVVPISAAGIKQSDARVPVVNNVPTTMPFVVKTENSVDVKTVDTPGFKSSTTTSKSWTFNSDKSWKSNYTWKTTWSSAPAVNNAVPTPPKVAAPANPAPAVVVAPAKDVKNPVVKGKEDPAKKATQFEAVDTQSAVTKDDSVAAYFAVGAGCVVAVAVLAVFIRRRIREDELGTPKNTLYECNATLTPPQAVAIV